MKTPIRLGLVGVGKIARDQHLPTIAASGEFDLVASASRNGTIEGIPAFASLEAMLDGDPTIEAVAMCQPPQGRFEAARQTLLAGKHVFLEKPPGATLGEVEILTEIARDRGVTLFAGWHSRHAPAVEPARVWLAERTIRSVAITWKEDVRVWHPGQDWIWAAGGFGVFDPGINALSIATHILPSPLFLESAALHVPANRAAPIAADLILRCAGGAPVTAAFDFRQTGPQIWNIVVDTDAGQLVLSRGGSQLTIAGEQKTLAHEAEYPSLYAAFASLIQSGKCDVDTRPLTIVADAFLRGETTTTEPFLD
jgi:D-galactose 1-dehydrogenase